MIDLFFLLALGLLVASLGNKILAFLKISITDRYQALAFCTALGLGALSYLVFALGVSGLANRYILYGILALLVIFCRREIVLIVRSVPHANMKAGRASEFLLMVAVGMAILFNFIGTLAPISSADALIYHMEAPRNYVQQQRIVEMPWEWTTYQPFNIEMLYLLGMLIWSDVLGALFHFLMGVLIAIAIFALCRRHMPSAHPLLATAIFYVSGLIAYESTSSFIELGLALFVILSFFAFLNWVAERKNEWLLLSGIFGGLAAGSKLNGAIFPAILFLMLIGYLASTHSLAIKPLLFFSVPILALMAPWYVRNYFWTGNLIYPFFSDLFGRRDIGAASTLNVLASIYGYGKDLTALILAPLNVTFRGTAFDNGQLIGPLYLALLPLSFFLAAEKWTVRLVLIFVGLYLLVWFYTAQLARYLLPILPLLAILASSGAMALLKMNRSLKAATTSVLFAGIAFGLAVTFVYDTQFFPVIFGFESKESFLARKTWYYQEILWMNKSLPPDARVLMTDGMPYYLDRVHETGPLETVLVRDDFDYVFCIEDCAAKLPTTQVVYQSLSTRVSSRTLQEKREPVQTYVLKLRLPSEPERTK